MKSSLIVIIAIGSAAIVLGLFFTIYSTIIGFALWIIGLIYSEYGKRKQAPRYPDLLEGQSQIISNQEKVIQYTKGSEDEIRKFQDFLEKEMCSRNIIERIRRSLKGVLSTEELVAEFDNPLNALLIYKWGEPPTKLIRDRLSELGFKDIGAGVKILPPSLMPNPPLKQRRHVEIWMKENILDSLPSDYKYTIVFAQIVDLRKAFTAKFAPPEYLEKYKGRTLFDLLSWHELFPIEYLRKVLELKTHVSVEELVVEHYPFLFLISRFISEKELARMIPQRGKIFQSIKNVFDIGNVTLTSFSDMDPSRLAQILNDFGLADSDKVADEMIVESNYWKLFLEKGQ